MSHTMSQNMSMSSNSTGCHHHDMSMSMNMALTLKYHGMPILFKGWAPENDGAFVAAWFAIFFIAILFRLLIWSRTYFETNWAEACYSRYRGNSSISSINTTHDKADSVISTVPCPARPQVSRRDCIYPPFRLQVEIPRMLLAFITALVGYGLMLIVMTYVVGYIFAVCSGLAIGELIFGRLSGRQDTSTSPGGCA